MIIYEVIETKEMLCGEISEDFHVIYEETENKEVIIENNLIVEKEGHVEKTLNIFKGDSHSTLQKVKAYPVRSMNEKDIREIVLKDFPELFKTAYLTGAAV